MKANKAYIMYVKFQAVLCKYVYIVNFKMAVMTFLSATNQCQTHSRYLYLCDINGLKQMWLP